MRLNNLIAGLILLRPYYSNPDHSQTGAEHDQFYAYKTDNPLSPDDVQPMRDLGWFQPDTEDDAPYDPEDGWSAFT